MLENLREEIKIFKIVGLVLLALYIVFYVKSFVYPEQLKLVTVYQEVEDSFLNVEKFSPGEEGKMKSFLQSAGNVVLKEKKLEQKYFPFYEKRLQQNTEPSLVLEDGEVISWSMPNIQTRAVAEVGVDLDGGAIVQVYYIDADSNIVTRFLSR